MKCEDCGGEADRVFDGVCADCAMDAASARWSAHWGCASCGTYKATSIQRRRVPVCCEWEMVQLPGQPSGVKVK